MRFAKPRIYAPHRVLEVTTRCLQSRFLLRPSQEVNNEIIAVLGRAQRQYQVDVYAFWFGSNHFHALISADSQWRISMFMGFVNGNIARRVGRIQRWRERFWCRRYQGIELTDEQTVARQRLRYMLEQGCKEGLCDSPLDWPGVTSAHALADGSMKLSGVWLDRSGLYKERVRLRVVGEGAKRKSRRERRRAAREIEEETQRRLDLEGGRSMGRERILAQDPHAAPSQSKRSPAPGIHAYRREQRLLWFIDRWNYLVEYRRASQKLRSGATGVRCCGFYAGRNPERTRDSRRVARLVVADASPLIGLARVDGVVWLRELFGEVQITQSVWRELNQAEQIESVLQDAIDQGWLAVHTDPESDPRPAFLGAGEWTTLEAARRHDGETLLLLDDLLARREADNAGLKFAGTAAIVDLARKREIIGSAREIFERLLQSDFRISAVVILEVLKDVEEIES